MNKNRERPPQYFRLAMDEARIGKSSSEYAHVIYTCYFTDSI